MAGGRGGTWEPPRPPKVRDETHWQAQVMGLNTFGAFKSHRHPVVIHQHMCWNVSPPLNIVSAGVRLMHGCFSLVHAEGHCWLALQRLTHIHSHVSLEATHTHQPAGRLVLQKSRDWPSPILTCLQPKNGER